MQQPGSLAGVAPPSSQLEALTRRLQDLEREVASLRTARSGEAMVIAKSPGLLVKNGAPVTIQDGATVSINDAGTIELNDGSTLNINDGGGLYLRTPAGHIIFRADRIDIPDGSGRQQQIIAFYRDDGTVVFTIADLGTTPGHTHQQDWAYYDRQGNVVFAEDTISGQGLAWPLISLGPFMSNSFPADTTTSGSFVTLQSLVGYKQQPKVWMQILGRSDDPSTAGEIRCIDQDGNVVGTVQTVTVGAYAYYTIGPVALAGTHGQPISLNLQARRTSGTGAIGLRGIGAWGLPS